MNPRPDSPGWTAAKAAGNEGEETVARVLRERGFHVFRSLGHEPIDLRAELTLEVKRDRLSTTTGNVAIEVQFRGEPSGISTSAADFWAIVLDAEVLIFRTPELKSLVQSGGYRTIPAGDGRRSVVALVPVEHLRRASRCPEVPR